MTEGYPGSQGEPVWRDVRDAQKSYQMIQRAIQAGKLAYELKEPPTFKGLMLTAPAAIKEPRRFASIIVSSYWYFKQREEFPNQTWDNLI